MLCYTVKVRTKLGSLRSKVIQADSEEAAIEQAKESFPLYDEIWIEGKAAEAPKEAPSDKAAPDRIGEMKRNAEIEKASAKRSEGFIWMAVGLSLILLSFAFMRDALLVALAPVIWGGYIYKRADNRVKTLRQEQAAGLPFLER